MPGAWDWRVEHENATGSAKSEIEILVTRNHMDSELSCRVNSSAMKVWHGVSKTFRSRILLTHDFSHLYISQNTLSFRSLSQPELILMWTSLRLNSLWILKIITSRRGAKSPWPALRLRWDLVETPCFNFYNFSISACRCKPIILSRTYFFSSCPQCLIGQVLENKMCCTVRPHKNFNNYSLQGKCHRNTKHKYGMEMLTKSKQFHLMTSFEIVLLNSMLSTSLICQHHFECYETLLFKLSNLAFAFTIKMLPFEKIWI